MLFRSGLSYDNVVVSERLKSRIDFLRKHEIKTREEIPNIYKEEDKFDFIFTANSNPNSIKDIFGFCRKGGQINFFGGLPKDSAKLSIDPNLLHYSEVTLTGTHGSTPNHHKSATEVIAKNEDYWSSLITKKFNLEDFSDFIAARGYESNMKVAFSSNG